MYPWDSWITLEVILIMLGVVLEYVSDQSVTVPWNRNNLLYVDRNDSREHWVTILRDGVDVTGLEV